MAGIEKLTPVALEHAEDPISCHKDEETLGSSAARRKAERHLVWKQDLTMLPLLAICFFFSYVVRKARDQAFKPPT
jgi:hypothetical protein